MKFVFGIDFRFKSFASCVAGLLYLCLAATASQASSDYSSRLWQMEDGLPHSIVQAITQTRDGYLWIGTREGLARFDGINFTPIDLSPDSLEPSIMSFCETRDGSLWIASENAGLFRLRNGRVSRFRSRDGLPNNVVYDLLEDKNGQLWIATRRGLAQYVDGEIRPMFTDKVTAGVWSLCLDQQGDIWASSGYNLSRLRGDEVQTHTVTSAQPPESIPPAIRRVYCDKKGKIWAGSNVHLIEMTESGFRHHVKDTGPAGIISVIFQDREENLWVGTYAGLGRFADGKFFKEDKNQGTVSRVHSIYEDREGNLWIGSEEGLARLTPRHITVYTRQEGLTQNTTAAVSAGSDNSIWIGVWGGGINRIKDGVITTYGKAEGLTTDFILSVLEGRDGSLWAGSDFGGGLHRLKDGKFTHFGKAEGLPDRSVIASLCEDVQGNIWVGTRNGLFRLRDGRFATYTTRQGLSHNRINSLYAGHDGILWIGLENGLMRYQSGAFTQEPACQGTAVVSIYEDTEQTLWVGTYGQGLKRIKHGQVDTYTSQHGLYSDSIFDIVEDDRHNLWVNSSKGIFRVSKSELEAVARGSSPSLTSIRYGRMAGIISSSQYREPVHPAATRSKDGKLWFRTNQGVASVDPNRVQPNSRPPSVVIEQVYADKKLVGSIDGEEPLAQAAAAAARKNGQPAPPLRLSPGFRLTVPPGEGELEIRYTALSYSAPEHSQFKYRLKGVDSQWVDAGNRRFAYYYNLPPGIYRFELLARNDDGVWNDIGATMSVELLPHYWQTWWFMTFCSLFAVSIIVLSVRTVTKRRLQQELARLEQQSIIEKERARIARDMHDDLGARLTEIMLLSDFSLKSAKTVEKAQSFASRITEASRELINNLDGLVWTVNPENDTLASLASYFREYLGLYLQSKPVRCRLDFPDKLPDCHLSSELRHNLLLVVKEALNNAVKYAEPSEINFRLRVQEGLLSIDIEDDGKGFQISDASSLGNGLKNMRKRMESIDGTYTLTSASGQGTKIHLQVRILPASDRTD